MQKDRNPDQKDALETVSGLLAGNGLMTVCALYRKKMTVGQLCRWMGDCSEETIRRELERLKNCGIVCQQPTGESAESAEHAEQNIFWQLTELGMELEKAFAELERFGRLYEKLLCFGLEVQEDTALWADQAELSEEKIQTEEKAPRSECRQRHGWKESGGQFLFFNPHGEYENWYFYGKISGETAAIYLITGEEYERMRECMAAGKDAAGAGSRLYLKIEMKAADLAPGQEAFYVRAEDLIIQESVREF